MKKYIFNCLSALLLAALMLAPTALTEEGPFPSEPPEEIIFDEAETEIACAQEDACVEEIDADLDEGEEWSEGEEIPAEAEEADLAIEGDTGDSYEILDGFYAFPTDPDALLDGYMQNLLFGNGQFEARNVGGGLTGEMRRIYNFLEGCVIDIAAGRRASTVCTIDLNSALTSADVENILNCLFMDHPYEFYWYSNGVFVGLNGMTLTFEFCVGIDYSAGTYQVNTAATSAASAAAANARAIVDRYASYSDYDKLAAYRDAICDAVSYNHAAANYSLPGNQNNPWQLIWVFDGNSSTNVVCEGYAKAFQYLCDMSNFSGNVMCYRVTGYVNGGAHMWNIVRMPNGQNYHVDITWCDQEASGTYDWTFMKAPVSGSMSGGYSFMVEHPIGYVAGTYVYDSITLNIYSSGDLTLSNYDYLDEAYLAAVDHSAPVTETTTDLVGLADGTSVEPAVTVSRRPTSVKVKAARKGRVTVSWKGIKKNKKNKALLKKINKIEVQVATDPNFTNIVSTKTVGKKRTKVTLKFKKKTTCYIRIRYVGTDGGVSKWSAVKKVKVKN